MTPGLLNRSLNSKFFILFHIVYCNINSLMYPIISMVKSVMLVISKPKLPRLIAEYMFRLNAVKNIGYIINKGTLGTVNVNVIATDRLNPQFTASIDNRTGLLFQSSLINLTVSCQSIKLFDQQFPRWL